MRMATLPVTKRWARLGPDNRRRLIHKLEASLCLSAFVIAQRGEAILLGRPHAHEAWPKKGGYPKWQAAELEKEGAWLLPATHLMVEEPPDRAAKRIANEWAGLKGTPKLVMVQSHLRPLRLWNRKLKGNHWDICFVYELLPKSAPQAKPWWAETRFVSPSETRKMNLGRGHRDILEEAGYV